MTTEQSPLKILALEVENFKRISVAEIKPDGSLVVIGGNNAQGKSSILDAIFAVLKGKSAVPGEPIHEGAEEGKITLDLGDYIAERTFQENGKTHLVVRSKDGARYNGPQDLLNKFLDNFGFDPHEFNRMKSREQCQSIAAITGIDFDDFASRRKAVFDKRTDINRHLKEAEAGYNLIKGDADSECPTELIVVSQLAKELSEAHDHNKEIDELTNKQGQCLSQIESIADKLLDLQSQLESWKSELKIVEDKMVEAKQIDTAELQLKIEGAEETNKNIEKQVQIKTAKDRCARGKEMADDLTLQIKLLDDEKENAIAAASMPVPGLDIADGVVMLNDHPFEQASSAEQIKACVLIGLAMNPTLRVLVIRDGSLLDEENLKLIADIAEENNAQVWIERVGAGEEVGFVLEDGRIK